MADTELTEDWRDVLGYEGIYKVSDRGRVFSIRRNLLMRPFTRGTGYLAVYLSVGGRQSLRFVSRLVLEAFVGPCPPGLEAAHLNGDKIDNRVENLAWVTHLTNVRHKILHGTSRNHLQPTLTEEQVAEIRRLGALGVPHSAIARHFPVSRQQIWRICNRVKWAHI